VRCAEEDSADEGEERGMVKLGINDSAQQGSIDDFDTERDLLQMMSTMNNFLKRSH
jgi:hypothetical protein